MGTYLGAVDLVTQNQLTIVARVGVNPVDRMLGDINPGQATIFVNNSSTVSRQVNSQVAAEFNIPKSISIVENIGGTQIFSASESPISFYSNAPNNTANTNKQVAVNYGNINTTVTNFSSQLFNTPGTYSWTVPDGVTDISVAGVGGGGGGSQKTTGGSGGGGGLISYSNQISVTPGTICTIVVGGGGATGNAYGLNGSSTYLLLPGTNVPVVIAQGGAGGDSMYWLSGSQGVIASDNTGTISTQVAFDPLYSGTITYSVSSGTLPTGASLNTNTGAISWVSQGIDTDAEYTPFILSATNGTQTISKPFTIKITRLRYVYATYAVVAGGGSGGAYFYAGGGGAGGLLTNVSTSTVRLTPGATYTITIGAGGAGGSAQANGGNVSSISGSGLSVSTTGGGRGGNAYNAQSYSAPTTGGSGGGGSSTGNSSGAAGTGGQGFGGGNGFSNQYAGGGGGSGGVGNDGTSSSFPYASGGTGTNLTSMLSTTLATSSGVGYVTTSSQVQFAGGGGGGQDTNINPSLTPGGWPLYAAPGAAGGGSGAISVTGYPAGDGQIYTGSGGGGACHSTYGGYSAGGSGGKGVVIIKYVSTVTLATGGDVIDANTSTGYITHIFKNSGSFVPTTSL
jgi:hypothetical protein